MKTSQKDDLMAKKWGCSAVTIQRWRHAGAPLSNDREMLVWLSAQRSIPARTRELLETVPGAVKTTAPRPTAKSGAAHALKRLEEAELDASDRLNEALRSGRALDVKLARTHWLEIIKQLHLYDESIAAHRRDDLESVPRETVEKSIELLSMFWSQLCGSQAHAAAYALSKETEPAKVVLLLREYFVNRLCHALAGLSGKRYGIDPPVDVPKWLVDAVASGFSKTSFASRVGARAEKVREVTSLLIEADDKAAFELLGKFQ